MRTGKQRLRVACRTISRGLLLVCIAFAGCGPLRAQSSNAQISGVVTDPSGSAVPGAEVTAVNGATGVPYATQTNGAGVYVLSQLLPGTYAITVTRSGFGNVVRSGLVVRTGDSLAQNITLTPGAVQQTVTVTGTAPLISSDQASTATVLDNKMITELPQLNRNTLDLTAVIPSVQGTGPLSDNIASLGNSAYLLANHGNSYSLSGGQVNGTSITVDGNQVQDSEFNASNRSIPTPDSIGEFRVDSGMLTANYGRYSGGVISMQTQIRHQRLSRPRLRVLPQSDSEQQRLGK